jgi:hypothetical protein
MKAVEEPLRGDQRRENRRMTDSQMFVAVGLPTIAILIGMLANAVVFHSISVRISRLGKKGDLVLDKLTAIDDRLAKVDAKLGPRL